MPMTEKQWQEEVLTLASWGGWAWFHCYDSRRSQPGFPDLVLWRERIIYAELKSQKGRVRPDQKRVMNELEQAGAEVYLWRPSDRKEVDAVLLARPPHK